VSVWTLRSRAAPAHVTPLETSVRTARDVGAMAPAAEPSAVAPPMVAPAGAGVASRPAATPSRPTAAPPRFPGRTAVARGAAAPGPSRPAPVTMLAAAPASAVSVDSARRDPVKKLDERPVVPAPESPTVTAARVEAPDPEPELRTLREAREDLRAGRPASAYRRLEDFNRQTPGGMLAQERSALSAIALCQAQPGREAQDRAAEFLRRSPESPLAARVKSACGPAREQSR